MTDIRKLIMDNVDDDKAARSLLNELELLKVRMSEREWALEEQLLEERTK